MSNFGSAKAELRQQWWPHQQDNITAARDRPIPRLSQAAFIKTQGD
jgi:hypothetical protein